VIERHAPVRVAGMLPLLALRAHGVVATGNALASKDELAEVEKRLANAIEKQREILELAEEQLTEEELRIVLDEAVEKTVNNATVERQVQKIIKDSGPIQNALAQRRASVVGSEDSDSESSDWDGD